MLAGGAGIEQIDEAMKRWGFPMGPFEVLDQVGLPVAAKITALLADAFEARKIPVTQLLSKMLERGWRGHETSRGFYTYEQGDDGKPPRRDAVNTQVYELAGSHGIGYKRHEIQALLGSIFVNEATRCLEEGVLKSPQDGDLGAVLGLGFPPFRGGPFWWCDQQTVRATVEALTALARQCGERFAAGSMLVQMAANDGRFYPQREGSEKT